MRRWYPWLWTNAVFLLASIGALTAQDAFAHTDDGCAVEIHCLACRSTANRSVEAGALPAPVPVLAPPVPVPAPALVSVACAPTTEPDSRGPPRLALS